MSKNVAGARAFLSGYGKSYSQLSADDRDRLARWYGITSASDLERSTKQKRMSKAPEKQKRMSKAPAAKKVKAHELVDRACKNKHLPAFLRKRYC